MSYSIYDFTEEKLLPAFKKIEEAKDSDDLSQVINNEFRNLFSTLSYDSCPDYLRRNLIYYLTYNDPEETTEVKDVISTIFNILVQDTSSEIRELIYKSGNDKVTVCYNVEGIEEQPKLASSISDYFKAERSNFITG